jgi:hypothetical protein
VVEFLLGEADRLVLVRATQPAVRGDADGSLVLRVPPAGGRDEAPASSVLLQDRISQGL